MSKAKTGKNENIIFDILIWTAIIIISYFLISKSYNRGFRRHDDLHGFLLIFGSIFINIGLSSGFKFKTNTVIYLITSLIGYISFLFWVFRKGISSPDDTLILVLINQFFIVSIYSVFYLLKKKDLTTSFNDLKKRVNK